MDILSILGDKKDGILNMKLDEAVKLEVIYLVFMYEAQRFESSFKGLKEW